MVRLWLLLAIPTYFLWYESVKYLVFLSWYANFVSELASYYIAKAKEKRDERDREGCS